MSKIGLILASQHYPAVTDDVAALDAQFRKWMENLGSSVDEFAVFEAYAGALPRHAGSADVWIVSGAVLPINGPTQDQAGALKHFLRAAAALGRPIFALNHAEHLVHDALAAINAPRPETSAEMRIVRNPFRSFQGRDTLHRFDPATRRVVQLDRPSTLSPRTLYGVLRMAA